MKSMVMDKVSGNSGVGYLRGADYTIYATRTASRTWHVWTDGYGEATGASLKAASKAWAALSGISADDIEFGDET